MLSPLRLLALGLPSDDVCALYGLTPEELDLKCEEAETQWREQSFVSVRPGKMMTCLLSRGDVAERLMRQTRRQAK